MARRILVTGGLGFIGCHLVRELLKDPHAEVTAVDNLSGTVISPEEIIRQITVDRPGKLKAVLVPVASLESETVSVFETIYHLASIVGPAAVLLRAGYITESIVRDTYVVMRLAQRVGARLINVSTSEVYGGGIGGLCGEDTPRVVRGEATARQEYAVGKMAAEVAIENLCRANKLNAVTVRPFNVAGIGQTGKGGFVLPRFIGQAILDRPLTVFGNGSQIRAFTDVRDVATGLVLVGTTGYSGQVFNLGNPKGRISIGDLANLVIEISGTRSSVSYIDPRSIFGDTYAESPDKFPDATRILKLGWCPEFTLEDTVSDTLAAMRALPIGQLLEVAGLPPSEQLNLERQDRSQIGSGRLVPSCQSPN